jgi:hypothetical protein
MKTISKILAALSILTSLIASTPDAAAQNEPPEVGFLRIINAVAAGQGNAKIILDGLDLFPKGYKLGQKTGGFGIKAGPHTVSIQKTGVETGTTQITLHPGQTLSMVAFAEKIAPLKEGDPVRWKTKILLLKQSDPENGYRLALLPVCLQDELKVDVQIQGKPQSEVVYTKRMAFTHVNLSPSKPEVNVSVAGVAIASIAPEDPGNYVVVIYEDESGKVKALSFYDPKFVIAG